jgi:hypothetical protein
MSRALACLSGLLLVAVAAATATPACAQTPAQVVALVEEIEPSPDDPAGSGRPLVTQVRAAFARDGTGWVPVCATAGAGDERPACLEDGIVGAKRWVLVRRGARTGEIRTDGWYDTRRLRTVGVLRLASAAPGGERSIDFAGMDDVAVRRPVVALAAPREGVPGGWRDAPVRRTDIEAAVKLFAPVMPKLPGCTPDAPTDTALAIEHFRPIGGLASSAGERVYGVRIDPARRAHCPGAAGVEWSDFWLYAKGTDAPQLLSFGPLGEAATRSTLVDIGDWDGDGKVDAVFWHAVPGEDGYVLVWGGFDNLVRAMRSYH